MHHSHITPKFGTLLILIMAVFAILCFSKLANATLKSDKKVYDTVVIGDAIYNVLIACHPGSQCADIMESIGLKRGQYVQLNLEQKRQLEQVINGSNLKQYVQLAVGSATNTIKTVAKLGGRSAFIGNVGKDEKGRELYEDLKSRGVDAFMQFKDQETAVSYIFIDDFEGERSMATYLGAAQNFKFSEILRGPVKAAKILVIEGYIWNAGPEALAAVKKALIQAKSSGVEVAFVLGAESVIAMHKADINSMLQYFDIIFGTKREFEALLLNNIQGDVFQEAQKLSAISVITMQEEGAVVVKGAELYKIPAEKAENIVDTTGAGDMFAGGFLFGYTHGYSQTESGKLGARMATQIIQKIGTSLD